MRTPSIRVNTVAGLAVSHGLCCFVVAHKQILRGDISLQQTSREWLAKSLIHRGKMVIPNCREAEIMGMAIRN